MIIEGYVGRRMGRLPQAKAGDPHTQSQCGQGEGLSLDLYDFLCRT